jgi:predicted  nucleic acid-binding Zn-ribbon protein
MNEAARKILAGQLEEYGHQLSDARQYLKGYEEQVKRSELQVAWLESQIADLTEAIGSDVFAV